MMFYRFLLRSLAFTIGVHPATVLAASQVTIPQIQGTGHASPFDGQLVKFEGVITLLRDGTFFIQDATGDGNDTTSDGILVRRKPSGLAVGDIVNVEGFVDEQQGRPGQFSTTTIKDPVFRKLGSGTVPVPILIGAGGRRPPTEAVVLPVGGFDPVNSGADFFECLEGMMVRIDNPVVVGPMTKRNVFNVVADGGSHATGMNSLGGITVTPGDSNPERIQIQIGKPLLPADFQVAVGDHFAALVGAVTTDNMAYGLQLVAATGFNPQNRVQPTAPDSADNVLTIAGYNVENLDTRVEDPNNVPPEAERDDDLAEGKFKSIAGHIVSVLGSPDIVALQEVQDNDGGEFSDVVVADKTLSALTDAIAAAGGPAYQTLSLDPKDDSAGGQPGANIRVAYLFNPSRVTVDQSASALIDDASFERTRLPLAAPFKFRGTEILVINVHLSSKSGSDPIYGVVQPPRDGTAAVRVAQARAIREFIRHLAPDPKRSVVVLGDFNTYWYEEPILLLTGGVPALRNLALDETPLERVSYVFDGNSQSLDHALVMLGNGQTAVMRTLHINSVLPEAQQTSDHDPKHVSITFGP